jgi:hypothetical protein
MDKLKSFKYQSSINVFQKSGTTKAAPENQKSSKISKTTTYETKKSISNIIAIILKSRSKMKSLVVITKC